MTFDETKIEFMKRFKTIKEIYRNESKKGICTTVLLTCGAKGVIKLAEGEADDFEKSILWAYAKATKDTHMIKASYAVAINRESLLMQMVKTRSNPRSNCFGVPISQPLSIGYTLDSSIGCGGYR